MDWALAQFSFKRVNNFDFQTHARAQCFVLECSRTESSTSAGEIKQAESSPITSAFFPAPFKYSGITDRSEPRCCFKCGSFYCLFASTKPWPGHSQNSDACLISNTRADCFVLECSRTLSSASAGEIKQAKSSPNTSACFPAPSLGSSATRFPGITDLTPVAAAIKCDRCCICLLRRNHGLGSSRIQFKRVINFNRNCIGRCCFSSGITGQG
jgi:hypothetical protein